ncbi:hypothetical protein FACS18942_06500 [Planctomycetales bacterium]|nr:hypothetical protein FACS18942_06500 [Planctomycetales bacterium]
MDETKKNFTQRSEFDDALKGYYTDRDEVRQDENMDYRSLNAGAVGSFICGILSILTIIHWIFAVFPFMGIILGLYSVRKILSASEVLSGVGLASAGVALSVLFSAIGFSCLYYNSLYSVPPGYEEITFEQLAPRDLQTGRLPQNIVALAEATQTQGQRVFIEGFMYPTRKMSDIDRFVLVPYLEQSKFGAPTRKSTEMVEVSLQGGLSAAYRTTAVKVGGILYVNPDYSSGEPAYRIDADIFR